MPAWLVYLLAIGLPPAMVALFPFFGFGPSEKPVSLMILPVIFCAYLGGLGPGLLTTLLTIGLADYLLMPPLYSLAVVSRADMVRLLTVLLAGLVSSLLSERLHRARQEAELSQRLYTTTLASIGDAVITTDLRGVVTFMNGEARRLTGWAEGLGQTLDVVFHIVDEEQGAPVESPVTKVLRTGAVVGLANRTLLIGRDGRATPIDDSGAPIEDGAGNVLGVVLVFRDVTEQRRAELALRESESRFRQLAESLPQLVWTATPAGSCDYLSPQWVAYTGVPAAEQLGYSWLQQVHPDDRDTCLAVWNTALAKGTNVQVEFRIRRHDGVYRWFDTRAMRLCDATGATVKWFGSNTDIDDQRRMTAELQRSERMLKLFVDMAPAAIAMFDQQMRYVAVSRRFLADYRLPPEPIIGRSHYEVFPEISEHWKAIHRRCLAGAVESCAEDSFPRADGSVDWVRWELHPWYEDATTVGGIVLFSELITDRKLAEAALKASEARYHQTLDSMLEGCQIIGFDWRYLYLNDSVERHARVPSQELLGRTMMECFPRIEQTELFCLLQRCMTERTTHRIENLFEYPDGTAAWFDLSIQPSPEGIFILSIDITDRKQAEADLRAEQAHLADRVAERTAELRQANLELARATRLKDEFLANMSHELRTPLTAILGRTELLLELLYGPLGPRQVESLRGVESSARHLLSLINDILDLSKIEAGKIAIEPAQVVVEALCQSSLQMVTQSARARQLAIQTAYDGRVTIISGDERRLKQILVNLLTNAVKFTPEGGTIGLEVRGDPLARMVSFIVWDTGIGIVAEHLPQLFQPFVQVDHGLNRQYEGTGLGLSLVWRLTEAHGGTVDVESTPGAGSRFTVTLPWEGPQPPSAGPPGLPDSNGVESPPAPAAGRGAGARILLAEDNEQNRQVVEEYLSAYGYTVATAGNGLEALAQAQEQTPALVLMDIQMPGMDGLEAIRRMRASPGLAQVPIVALTALAMPGDRERCLAAGASAYLSKPVRLAQIRELIVELLR